MENMCKSTPLVYSVKDLSDLLCISQNTAYMLVRSRQIRSIRIGRSYRIPHDAVEEYLQINRSNTTLK